MLNALKSLWINRQLVAALLRRQLTGRFQGSVLGRLWLLLSPLIMLAIYALVFGKVLQAKWQIGNQDENLANFALILFSGLLIHQFFAECMGGAPNLILGNPNFVKKIIFPLEILPWIHTLAAGIQGLFSVFVLLCAVVILGGKAHWAWLLLPLVYLPLVFVSLGVAWLLAALGVFARDLQQIVGFVSSALLFLSPVFYPMSTLPERLQFLVYANPLIIIIEESRKVIFSGLTPDWSLLLGYSAVALPFMLISLWFFQRCKRLFADVM